jgi:hypothetical protein
MTDPWAEAFLHHANLERFRRLLASTTDEAHRETLLKLLAAEEAKRPLPLKVE